jgi:hypothetical protein
LSVGTDVAAPLDSDSTAEAAVVVVDSELVGEEVGAPVVWIGSLVEFPPHAVVVNISSSNRQAPAIVTRTDVSMLDIELRPSLDGSLADPTRPQQTISTAESGSYAESVVALRTAY